MLAGEELGRVGVLGRHDPLRRPARRDAVGVRGLVQDRVDRVALEAEQVLRVVAEGRRVGRELDQRVQILGAVAHPQLVARLAEAPGGEAVAGRQDQRLRVEPLDERAHPRAVVRVALVVAPVALQHPLVGRAIDVVDVPPDRRQPAGDERLAQPLGRDREVGHDAEAAEALAEDAPALHAELGADRLGVAHDRVGAEVLEVVGLLGGGEAGQRAHRRGAAGTALVEHQDAEVLQRPLEPARRARVPRRPRRLGAGAALEEDEERAGRCRRGSATSRAKTVIDSPPGRSWSSGSENSCSVSTSPWVV